MMKKVSIQDLLHTYVDSGGRNVSIEQVEPYLKDPDPLNRRIAYELMNGLTGDPVYLIRCIKILKDDPEALWEYLLDYTSELKDVFVISLLMIEGMRYLDPLKHPQKLENLIFNWARLNPALKSLPEDKQVAEKILALYHDGLPVIANIFVSWILAGYKYPLFFDLDMAPYYIYNNAGLSHKFPENAWQLVEANPEEYKSYYERAMLSLYECNFEQACNYFITSVEKLLNMQDIVNAYNIIFGWYSRTEFCYEETPHLIAQIEETLYKIVKMAFEKEIKNDQLIMMSVSLYTSTCLRLTGTDYFKYDRIMELSQLYEQKILSYKNLHKILYRFSKNSTGRVNIGYAGMSLNKSHLYSSILETIKHHDSSKFNVYFYDCGMNPAMSAQFAPELTGSVTLRSVSSSPDEPRMSVAVKLAEMIYEDNIDIIIYLDWLYNIVGQAMCVLQPAPLIVQLDTTNISTGLSNVPYVLDFMGMVKASSLAHTEIPVPIPMAFFSFDLKDIHSSKSLYHLPEDSIVIYSDNTLQDLKNENTIKMLTAILKAYEDVYFVFSSPEDASSLLALFEKEGQAGKVRNLPFDGTRKSFLEKIKMCDIYIDTPGASHAQGIYTAMFYAKPVITIEAPSEALISERIGPTMLALDLCVAKNMNDYIDKLVRVIDSEDLRLKIGNQLEKIACEKFNVVNTIEELEKNYQCWRV